MALRVVALCHYNARFYGTDRPFIRGHIDINAASRHLGEEERVN
jgi:hypothetical protein